jgi:DNA-binding GntR family transcriptional regulator
MATERSELLIDEVYARLRDLILSNVLRAGQKLVDRDLAEQLGVSRTPVREALGRLAMTGLVEARTRRGYYVSTFSAEEVSDLYEFRKMLEVHAARLAAQNAQPSHLRELDRILGDSEKLASDPTNHAKAVKLDLEIHELIARASGNASLHKAIHNLLDKVMCFIWVDDVTVDVVTLAAAHRQHQALLHMIKEKDAEGAAVLIRTHIDGAQERLEKVFQARDDLRDAVLSAAPPKRRSLDQRVLDVKTQQGGTL